MALALVSKSQAKSLDHQIQEAFSRSSYASFLKYEVNFTQSVEFSTMTFWPLFMLGCNLLLLPLLALFAIFVCILSGIARLEFLANSMMRRL